MPLIARTLLLALSCTTSAARLEVFGFGTSGWQSYDWDVITTACSVSLNIVADFAPGGAQEGLPALAHAHGARVVIFANAVRNGTAALPLDPGGAGSAAAAARAVWVAEAAALVERFSLDGINFDYEQPLNASDPRVEGYVALVADTRAALRAAHAARVGSAGGDPTDPTDHSDPQQSRAGRLAPQISVDVGWSVDIDGRYYDGAGFAAHADYLYVMGYDVQSQYAPDATDGRCHARANAPLGSLRAGLRAWIERGVPAAQLLLGVPWYGFGYSCLDNEDGPGADAAAPAPSPSPSPSPCAIAAVPFRGSPCSDAAGGEQAYVTLSPHLRANEGTLRWDGNSSSPFFEYVVATAGGCSGRGDVGSRCRVWFDNPRSLAAKLALVAELQLGGGGPYEFSDLDYSGSSEQGKNDTAAMWQTLRDFAQRQERNASNAS